jgi:hypothetical protein
MFRSRRFFVWVVSFRGADPTDVLCVRVVFGDTGLYLPILMVSMNPFGFEDIVAEIVEGSFGYVPRAIGVGFKPPFPSSAQAYPVG